MIEKDIIQEETGADDIEEIMHVMLYLRCDEGSGDTLNDLTDNLFKVKLNNDKSWSPNKLVEREPLEYEDKWGKVSQPSYSLDLNHLKTLDAPDLLGKLIS